MRPREVLRTLVHLHSTHRLSVHPRSSPIVQARARSQRPFPYLGARKLVESGDSHFWSLYSTAFVFSDALRSNLAVNGREQRNQPTEPLALH